jgi:hypothetical protein
MSDRVLDPGREEVLAIKPTMSVEVGSLRTSQQPDIIDVAFPSDKPPQDLERLTDPLERCLAPPNNLVLERETDELCIFGPRVVLDCPGELQSVELVFVAGDACFVWFRPGCELVPGAAIFTR